MTPNQIKKALASKGITQKMISKELKVSITAVHLVIKGTSVSKNIRQHIANRIGKCVTDVFPSMATPNIGN